MNSKQYKPGTAFGAHVEKGSDNWQLVLVRELKHAPEKVWAALTDPTQLREWAPFDADGNLGVQGATVKLSTIGAPAAYVAETQVLRAEAPILLEYKWGGSDIRWQLESMEYGTRLTLWHNIDKRFVAMGAAGWHICFDVLDHWLSRTPIGRTVGPDAMKFDGFQRLHAEYAKQFGIATPDRSAETLKK
jgi:uncharacterized protein YndB with AHSA1/START domain